tara:strand:- start:1038 stop:1289 length:252 start_codon:yes stop_codon:yes gene_type:complete
MVELLLLLLFVDGNGGGGGGICLTSALLLNIGNAGGGTNRCFRLLFLLYNIIDIKFIYYFVVLIFFKFPQKNQNVILKKQKRK